MISNNVLLTRNTFDSKENSQTKSQRVENNSPCHRKSDKAGIVKPKIIQRDKEGQYIFVK